MTNDKDTNDGDKKELTGENPPSTSSNPPDERAVDLHKVAVRYAPFNREDPEIWFIQLEAQLALAGITQDRTKHGHLLAALDAETIKYVRMEIRNPPATDKYGSLKTVIMERLAETGRTKLNRLLSGMQLGDKKPSQLLREMQDLAADQFGENALQNLWLTRLPQHTQEILTGIEAPVERLAATADKIHDISATNVCGISNPHILGGVKYPTRHPAQQTERENQLELKIEALSKKIDELKRAETNNWSPQPSTSGSDSRRSKSKDRSTNQQKKFPHCWFHFKYGDEARKCTKPCSFIKVSDKSKYRPG